VLRRHQDGASPLSAQADALQETQDDQQDRRRDAYGGEAWKKPDQERGDPHHQEGEDQHRLAPDPVAVMAEDNGTQRTGEEGDRERGEGG
jgi:hypothetical protein